MLKTYMLYANHYHQVRNMVLQASSVELRYQFHRTLSKGAVDIVKAKKLKNDPRKDSVAIYFNSRGDLLLKSGENR